MEEIDQNINETDFGDDNTNSDVNPASTTLDDYFASIGGSKVSDLISSTESIPEADLFRRIQSYSNKFGELLDNSTSSKALFARNANAIIRSSPSILKVRERTSFTAQSLINKSSTKTHTPFYSRPDESVYTGLIKEPGSFKASFFQFQEVNVLAALNNKKDFSILTQDIGQDSIYGDSASSARTTASILGGNRLSMNVAERYADSRRTIRGVTSFGSFHPKVGYTNTRSFIGTQNITPTLARKSSMESLLVFRRDGVGIEGTVADEIVGFTDSLHRVERSLKEKNSTLVRPGEVLNQQASGRQFLYVNNELNTRISSVISAVTSSSDKLIISMGEISLLLNRTNEKGLNNVSEMKNKLRTLAEQKRLMITTDSKGLNRALDSESTDTDFIEHLTKNKAINTATTSFHHEKAIAVYGQNQELKFLSLGSANMSSFAMLPIGQLDDETQTNIKNKYNGLSPNELLDTLNTEATVAFGTGKYADSTRHSESQQVMSYLDNVNKSGLLRHFNNLSAGFIENKRRFYSGTLADKFSDVSGIDKLKVSLQEINKRIGYNAVSIEDRYSLDYTKTIKKTGLRVTVKGMDDLHSLTTDLTVSASGSVISNDLNKIIGGSIFVNKSTSSKNIFGKILKAGHSTELSGIETATALIGTVARTFNYQTRNDLATKVFEQAIANDSSKEFLGRSARKLISNVFGEIIPDFVNSSGGTPSLSSFIGQIDSQNNTEAYSLALEKFASGLYEGSTANNLSEAEVSARRNILNPVFNLFTNKYLKNSSYKDVSFVNNLLSTLDSDSEGLLNDVKLSLLSNDEYYRKQLKDITKTQSRAVLGDLMAPFLGAHELGYSSMQVKARKPIYGSENNFIDENVDSPYFRSMEEGLLNPLTLKHGTYVGEAGKYTRLINAVTPFSPLKLPGVGGIQQLRIFDSDINSGASVASSNEVLMRSTSGLALFTNAGLKADTEKLLRLNSGGSLTDEELQQQQEINSRVNGSLYHVPFPKAEQIPQRLKNVLGARPAFEIDETFAFAARTLDVNNVVSNLSPNKMIASRLKEVLPTEQFEQALAKHKELSKQLGRNATYYELQEYYRGQELNPFTDQHGWLGGRSMKRIALQAGFSMMSDFAFGNAGYKNSLGSNSIIRLKIHQDAQFDIDRLQDSITQSLSKGSVLTTKPLLVTDPAQTKTIIDTFNDGTFNTTYGKDYLVKNNQVFRKEGLFSLINGNYEKTGDFTEDGFVRLRNVETVKRTSLGLKSTPILIKMAAFGKRHQNGVTVISSTPHLQINARGVLNVEAESMTVYDDTSSSRVAGSGLAKGPVFYVEQELFNKTQKMLNESVTVIDNQTKSYTEYLPSSIKNNAIYQMRSFSLNKGYNYESGLYLLSQKDSRAALSKASGSEVARSTALLFLKDSKIRAALHQHLEKNNLSQSAESINLMTGGFDWGSANEHLRKGVAFLSNSNKAIINSSVEETKEIVLKALGGDKASEKILEQQSKRLFSSIADSNTGLIDEGSALNKGAGLLAHMMFYNRQIFNTRAGSLSGAMLERNFDNYAKYMSDPAHRTFVDLVATTAGLSLQGKSEPVIKSRLNLLQSIVGSGFTMETIQDITVSRSLVPAGMSDEVKMEFQYLTGISNKYLKQFEPVIGKDITIQTSFQVLSAIASQSRVTAVNAKNLLKPSLALVGNKPGLLSIADLHLRRFLIANNDVAKTTYHDGLKHLAETGRGGRALGTLEQISRYSTNMADVSIEKRTEALTKFGVNYFKEDTISAISSGIEELTPRYRQYKERQRDAFEEHTSFFDWAATTDSPLSRLSKEHNLQDILETDGRLNINYDDVIGSVRQKLSSINATSVSLVDKALGTDFNEQYLRNISSADAYYREQGSDYLNNVRESKNILLPQFHLKSQDDGSFDVNFVDPRTANPISGVLLGSDVLANSALVFGNYKDDILTSQVDLVQSLIENTSLLARIPNSSGGLNVSAAEAERLMNFRSTLEKSGLAPLKLLETDLVRKAFGDHEGFKGAVGIAVSSFALDPDQAAIGSRFNSLVDGSKLTELLHNQISLAIYDDPNRQQQHVSQLAKWVTDVQGYDGKEQANVLKSFQEGMYQTGASSKDLQNFLENSVYGQLTKLSPDEIARKRLTAEGQQQLKKMVDMSIGGGVRRSGAPAGVSGQVGENIDYSTYDSESYNALLSAQTGSNSLLRADHERFSTGMVLPAISRLMAGLGDYDGDSYQLLFNRYGEASDSLVRTQKHLLTQTKKKKKLDELLHRRLESSKQKGNFLNPKYTQKLQQKVIDSDNRLEEIRTEYQMRSNDLNQLRKTYSKVERKAVSDLSHWSETFLSLPKELTGRYGSREGLSVGNTLGLISQRFSMDGITDGVDIIRKTEQKVNLFGKLFDPNEGGFVFSKEALEPHHIPDYVKHLKQFSQDVDENKLTSQVTDVLKFVGEYGSDQKSYDNLLNEYFAGASNKALAIDNLSSSLKKASGSVLNPFEFEGIQGLIGRGGTDFIGKTYNAFIPLLDQVVVEQTLSSAIETSEKTRTALKGSLSPELFSKITSPEFHTSVKDRFAGVTGFLGATQQLIRDALKAKEGGSLQSILGEKQQTEFGFMNVGEAMDALPENLSPAQADKERVKMLTQTLSTKLGPVIKQNIERNPFFRSGDSIAKSMLGDSPADTSITGFGALLDFAAYTTTEDAHQFIDSRNLREHYNELLNSGKVTSPDDFSSKYMHSLIERTQASYLADTISPPVAENMLEHVRDYTKWAEQDGNIESFNEHQQQRYSLIKEFEGMQPSADTDKRLIEGLILSNIQEQNKRNNVLTPEHLQDLRDRTIGLTPVRFGLSDNVNTSISERMSQGNALTHNSYIRRLRRGQHVDASEAAYAAQQKFDFVDSTLNDLGMDPNSFEAGKTREAALYMAGFSPFIGNSLNPSESKELMGAIVGNNETFKQVRGTTAALNKMTSWLDMSSIETGTPAEYTAHREYMANITKHVYSNGNINVDRVETMTAPTPDVSVQTAIENHIHRLIQPDEIREAINRGQESTDPTMKFKRSTRVEDINQTNFHKRIYGKGGLETIGILASPLLMAFASNGTKVNERMGVFAVDTLQAIAQNAASSGSVISDLVDNNKTAAVSWQRQRIRQSIENEGFVKGTIQAISQETTFKAVNELTHAGIQRLLGPKDKIRQTGSALATIGTELISTVLAQSVARGFSKTKTMPGGSETPDTVTRLIGDFVAQVWNMAEQIQLNLLDPDYEVVDTDESLSMDFETTAYPSEYQWDYETGLIVMDQNSNPIATEFESSSSEQSQLRSGL